MVNIAVAPLDADEDILGSLYLRYGRAARPKLDNRVLGVTTGQEGQRLTEASVNAVPPVATTKKVRLGISRQLESCSAIVVTTFCL
ncbi:MAG: hypothetical protein LJE70_20100 [Chromatiaceae bacterium]|nr:hypothetical protein [Chromatiaceae bacterium]